MLLPNVWPRSSPKGIHQAVKNSHIPIEKVKHKDSHLHRQHAHHRSNNRGNDCVKRFSHPSHGIPRFHNKQGKIRIRPNHLSGLFGSDGGQPIINLQHSPNKNRESELSLPKPYDKKSNLALVPIQPSRKAQSNLPSIFSSTTASSVPATSPNKRSKT